MLYKRCRFSTFYILCILKTYTNAWCLKMKIPSKKELGKFWNKKARAQLLSGVVIALMVISAFTGLFLMSERASAAWDTPGDYSHHYKITINNGGSALTNFQIKVILNSSNINYSYWQSNGYDTLLQMRPTQLITTSIWNRGMHQEIAYSG